MDRADEDPTRIKAEQALFRKIVDVGCFDLFGSGCCAETTNYDNG